MSMVLGPKSLSMGWIKPFIIDKEHRYCVMV
jgi:hypothetical protein